MCIRDSDKKAHIAAKMYLKPGMKVLDIGCGWGGLALYLHKHYGCEVLGVALAADGTWMIVEPFASDKPEENHNVVGRVYYSASTMLCVPHSLSQHGPALGAQAGEARLRDVIVKGGG